MSRRRQQKMAARFGRRLDPWQEMRAAFAAFRHVDLQPFLAAFRQVQEAFARQWQETLQGMARQAGLMRDHTPTLVWLDEAAEHIDWAQYDHTSDAAEPDAWRDGEYVDPDEDDPLNPWWEVDGAHRMTYDDTLASIDATLAQYDRTVI